LHIYDSVRIKNKITTKGEEMKLEEKSNDHDYQPPKVEVIIADDLLKNFNPTMSCSGYGGAVSNC
jgi:hypothetical protein